MAGRVTGPLLAVALGTVLGLVLVESGLRVAAFFAARAAREHVAGGDGDGRPVVAFIGDSNIYGIFVEPGETLPKLVEQLSRRHGARGITSVNLGLPGTPSWVAVEQMKRALAFRPRAVVATVGANDYRAVRSGQGLGPLEELRIVRAVRLALFNLRLGRRGDVSGLLVGPGGAVLEGAAARMALLRTAILMQPRDGSAVPFEFQFRGAVPFDGIEPVLRSSFLEMASLAEAAGARLVLATYLVGREQPFAPITELMLSLRDQHGIAVADTAAVFPAALQGSDPEPLASWSAEKLQARRSLLVFRDAHPTALGYEVEARVVLGTLATIGVLPDDEPEEPLAPIAGHGPDVPRLRQVAERPCAFEVEARPHDHATLLLGRSGTSKWNGVTLPFEWLSTVGTKPTDSLSAEADADGRARIVLPESSESALTDPLWAAAVVERGARGSAAQTLLTPAIRVERPERARGGGAVP